MTTPTIHITIEIDCSLTVDEVWPDGDAPAEITEDAVREAMMSSMRRFRPTLRRPMSGDEIVTLAQEWDLAEHATLTVRIVPR